MIAARLRLYHDAPAPSPADTVRELCPLWLPCDVRTREQVTADLNATLDRLRVRAGRLVLAELRGEGYRLWLEQGTLRLNGARMTDEAAAKVERFRDEIVAALAAE